MRPFAFTTALIATACMPQEPAAPAAPAAAITVPAGTKVQLRLTSPLGTTTAHPGDAVRAEVAFPVTASSAVAIPAGTFVEGAIDQVIRTGRHAGFTMHFAKLVFVNGYTVPLPAATADTRTAAVRTVRPPDAAPAGPGAAAGAMAFQTTPTAAQPSMPGPGKGALVGIGVGAAAAAIITAVALAHRGSPVYLKTGWKFEMTLAAPLSLDASKVAAAVAIPASQ